MLQPLSYAQIQRLATLSAVPFTTLWKIRVKATENPRIETVRSFLPHIKAASAEDTRAAA